ncbi:hypothetical protein EJ02DRAFT_439675 [Clathrospora elynae]|uniref:Uncharacterized protein n=1 Tax=Clathrospora elynae TaxID=706981 RepID=A0A6A5S4B0_9PLEO|nr:hypothetical protein EJ02DRAFT_439675 [Clathrospora elynae]
MAAFAGQQPLAPERIPTDTIIPLHSRDDTEQNRKISVEFTMRFDSVLDAEKLAAALWKLLEKPGWKKLGARLRMKENGKLEYHVPASYSKERPPINFTQTKYDMPFSEHQIGALFPDVKDGGDVQTFDVLDSLHVLTQTENSTVVLADWIYTDKAQLGLHVVNFQDATLVTITWLHTLLDAMGRQALLKAWTAVLEGRGGDVPEFWGYDFDPLEKLGALQESEAKAEDHSIGPDSLEREKESPIQTITATQPQRGDGRMIYIPASYMSRLRTSALHDLSTLDPADLTLSFSNTLPPTPFLSDGDILCAWLTRHIATSHPYFSATRPVVLVNVLGMRDVLTTSTDHYDALIPKGVAYIGNATSGIASSFGAGQFLDMPLGHVAARLRKDLVAQGTREAVETSQRAPFHPGRETKKEGDVDTAPAVFVFTNWAKANFFETDFSAVIVGEDVRDEGEGREGVEKGARGKPSYIHVYGTDQRGFHENGMGNVAGKDAKGNYWMGAVMSKEFVGAFDKAVKDGQ